MPIIFPETPAKQPFSLKKVYADVYQYLFNSSGDQVKQLAENTGEAFSMNMGSSDGGTTLERIKTETTGEQDIVLHGKDSGSNIDALRTNADQELIVDINQKQTWQDVNPVEIPSTEDDLWDPAGTSAEVYEIEFLVVNNDAGLADVTVSVGLDLASGGSLAAPEYWMFNEIVYFPTITVVPNNGTSGWRGPFIMRGDDQVRGIASVANDASIHFRIKRVDS